MNLRRATLDDAPALAKAHVESWLKAYRGIVPDARLHGFTVERQTERFRQSLAEDSEETYVAELDGQILGFLTLGDCRDSDVDHSTTGEIWGIYLLPQHWRKGIGRFLAKQGESMLASRGCSFVTLWVLEANGQARRFYEAVGFETDGATKQKAIRYRKKLKDTEPATARRLLARLQEAGLDYILFSVDAFHQAHILAPAHPYIGDD